MLPTTVFAAGPSVYGGSDGGIAFAERGISDGSTVQDYQTKYWQLTGDSLRFSLVFFEGAGTEKRYKDKDGNSVTDGWEDLKVFSQLMTENSDRYKVRNFGSIDVIYNSGAGTSSNAMHFSTGTQLTSVYDYMNNLYKDNEGYEYLSWLDVVQPNFNLNYEIGNTSHEYAATNINFKGVAFNDSQHGGFPDIYNDRSLKDKDVLCWFFTGANNNEEIFSYSGSDDKVKNVQEYFAVPEHYEKVDNLVTIAQAIINKSGLDITLSKDNVLYGTYTDGEGHTHNGIFQLYVEPLMYLSMNGYKACLSFRELFSAYTYYKNVIGENVAKKLVSYNGTIYREISEYVPSVGGTLSMPVRMLDGVTRYVSGGTVTSITKTGNSVNDGVSHTWYEYSVVVENGQVTIDYGSGGIGTAIGGIAALFADKMHLTRAEGQPILRMEAKSGDYGFFGDYNVSTESNIFKSGGLNVFTSFNAFLPSNPQAQPVNIVKYYVVKQPDGTYKPYGQPIVERVTKDDVLINADGTLTNVLQVNTTGTDRIFIQDEDRSTPMKFKLIDTITTAEHFEQSDLEKTVWTNKGENAVPTALGK